jgi:hypothetical protein
MKLPSCLWWCADCASVNRAYRFAATIAHESPIPALTAIGTLIKLCTAAGHWFYKNLISIQTTAIAPWCCKICGITVVGCTGFIRTKTTTCANSGRYDPHPEPNGILKLWGCDPSAKQGRIL